MTPARGPDLACFGYLAHARILHVAAYPPANTGVQVAEIIPSLAGDAPLTALTARRLGLTTSLLSNPVSPDPDGHTILAWQSPETAAAKRMTPDQIRDRVAALRAAGVFDPR